MESLGLAPDNSSLPLVLKACARLSAVERGKRVHSSFRNSGLDKDVRIGTALVDFYCKRYTEIVQLLVNSANDTERVKRMLEAVDAEGDTPLHHAARGEHADIIRLLLGSGASPTKAFTESELPEPNTEAKGILEAAAGAMACQ